MKAFSYDKYGPPQTLRMAEAGKPAPDAGEVLVKVLATSAADDDQYQAWGASINPSLSGSYATAEQWGQRAQSHY